MKQEEAKNFQENLDADEEGEFEQANKMIDTVSSITDSDSEKEKKLTKNDTKKLKVAKDLDEQQKKTLQRF